MPTCVTREEFDARVRVLESEVEGEKAVTPYIFDQARRNAENLAAVKTELESIKMRLDHHDGEFVLLKSALTSHTALLNVLTQDVGQLRQGMGEMRRDMGQLRQEMGDMRRDVDTVRVEIGTMRADMDTMRTEMGAVRVDVAAIRAAVLPREPRPGA